MGDSTITSRVEPQSCRGSQIMIPKPVALTVFISDVVCPMHQKKLLQYINLFVNIRFDAIENELPKVSMNRDEMGYRSPGVGFAQEIPRSERSARGGISRRRGRLVLRPRPRSWPQRRCTVTITICANPILPDYAQFRSSGIVFAYFPLFSFFRIPSEYRRGRGLAGGFLENRE